MNYCRLFLLCFFFIYPTLCYGQAGTQPQCFLIMAGVSDYAPGAKINPLRFAARDARDLAVALNSGAQKRFGSGQVRLFLLTGERNPGATPGISRQAATKDNFKTVFATVASQAQANDTVLVFLAGHGVPLGSSEYAYLTQDAVTADLINSPFRVEWSLSGTELRTWFHSLKSKRRAIILDTCAAGAFTGEGAEKQPAERAAWDKAGFSDALGFPVLMGSAADAASHEAIRFGHGLLTYALLEGLRAQALQQGRCELEPWLRTAVTRVGELAREVQGAQQPILSWPAEPAADFILGQFDAAAIAALPALHTAPLLAQPRLTSPDDPGGELDRKLEQLVIASLRQAELRGEVQLVPRDVVTSDAVFHVTALVNRNEASVSLNMVLRYGEQKIRWNTQGNATNLPALAEQIAADILKHLALS